MRLLGRERYAVRLATEKAEQVQVIGGDDRQGVGVQFDVAGDSEGDK